MTTPLSSKITEKKQELLKAAQNNSLTDELLDELLDLKAQECVEPTELHIPVSDVVNTIDMGAVCFKICKTGILFHAKSGYSTWISARCISLYEQLTNLIGYIERFDEMDNEEKKSEQETYENAQSALDCFLHLLQSPIGASISPLILFRTATEYVKVFASETERILGSANTEESAETEVANANAEQAGVILDAMASQVKD